jgi:hypothetical protein
MTCGVAGEGLTVSLVVVWRRGDYQVWCSWSRVYCITHCVPCVRERDTGKIPAFRVSHYIYIICI